MKYATRGVCSREINFEVKDGKLHNVTYVGGCNGNLKGLGVLLEGMSVDDAIERLGGIKCGFKNTSCPDQLANALNEYKKGNLN